MAEPAPAPCQPIGYTFVSQSDKIACRPFGRRTAGRYSIKPCRNASATAAAAVDTPSFT